MIAPGLRALVALLDRTPDLVVLASSVVSQRQLNQSGSHRPNL
jgi:hypothetical protein